MSLVRKDDCILFPTLNMCYFSLEGTKATQDPAGSIEHSFTLFFLNILLKIYHFGKSFCMLVLKHEIHQDTSELSRVV